MGFRLLTWIFVLCIGVAQPLAAGGAVARRPDVARVMVVVDNSRMPQARTKDGKFLSQMFDVAPEEARQKLLTAMTRKGSVGGPLGGFKAIVCDDPHRAYAEADAAGAASILKISMRKRRLTSAGGPMTSYELRATYELHVRSGSAWKQQDSGRLKTTGMEQHIVPFQVNDCDRMSDELGMVLIACFLPHRVTGVRDKRESREVRIAVTNCSNRIAKDLHVTVPLVGGRGWASLSNEQSLAPGEKKELVFTFKNKKIKWQKARITWLRFGPDPERPLDTSRVVMAVAGEAAAEQALRAALGAGKTARIAGFEVLVLADPEATMSVAEKHDAATRSLRRSERASTRAAMAAAEKYNVGAVMVVSELGNVKHEYGRRHYRALGKCALYMQKGVEWERCLKESLTVRNRDSTERASASGNYGQMVEQIGVCLIRHFVPHRVRYPELTSEKTTIDVEVTNRTSNPIRLLKLRIPQEIGYVYCESVQAVRAGQKCLVRFVVPGDVSRSRARRRSTEIYEVEFARRRRAPRSSAGRTVR